MKCTDDRSQALSNFYIQLTVAAVLDWELSTLGDPILDLAYNCVPYHCPSELADVLPAFSLGEFYQTCLPIPKVFHFLETATMTCLGKCF